MNKPLFFTLLLTAHIVYSTWISYKILKSEYLNITQRIIHTFLTLLIPFIWGTIINGIIKPTQLSVMTKRKRKKRAGKNTDNWKTLTGFGAGGRSGGGF